MKYSHSPLFDKAGYIPIKDYVRDISEMRRVGPWKLPLGLGERLHLFFLSLVARWSWFSELLYIQHPSDLSPAYSLLVAYLNKRDHVDNLAEVDFQYREHFFYYMQKELGVDDGTAKVSGQGVATDKSTALSKALGEMLERTISGVADTNEDVRIASPRELMKKHPVFYPPQFHRFLPVQMEKYPELQSDLSEMITWVVGENIITHQKTYIPKQVTSWFYGKRSYKKILMNATSNGCAGYFTSGGAILRGLLEVVERDAFLVHWLTQIPPNIIIAESLPAPIRDIINEFASLGISLHILETTSIAIPSVSVIAINDKSSAPQVVVSAASAPTYEEAIARALTEQMSLSGAYYFVREKKYRLGPAAIEPFVTKINKWTRQSYWQGAERIEQFQWFLSGKHVSFSEISARNLECGDSDESRLKACLEVLRSAGCGYEPVVYRPKNRMQKDLGFYVAQVFIPKAFPFYLQEHRGTFDSDRLNEFALSRGVQKWTLNPLPHMFS